MTFRMTDEQFQAHKVKRAAEFAKADGYKPLPEISIYTPMHAACDAIGLRYPVPEYKFHPTRKWRLDWAWVEDLVAIEFQGGVFTQGKHSRGVGQMNDMEKMNAALLLGWRVFYFVPSQQNEAAATIKLMLAGNAR